MTLSADLRKAPSAAIMTWYTYCNYGTALQAVALNRVISSFGYDARDLAYDPALGVGTHEPDVRGLSARIAGKVNRALGGASVDDEQRNALFDNFLSAHLPVTATIPEKAALRSVNGDFDVFVCGSDQVWSPRCFDSSYYLDFVEDASRMVAYAPSFGCDSLEPFASHGEISGLLRRFDHISVREAAGADIVEDCTGRRPTVVLDPTLLLPAKTWGELSRSIQERTPYCLVYFLGSDRGNWKAARAIAQAKGLRLVIVPVFERDKRRRGASSNAIGPAEFLWLVEHAELVCTDSFHGMVFSTVFQRNFVAFERFDPKSRESQNTRVYNFLQMAGAEDALLARSERNEWRRHLSSVLDYKAVAARIEEKRGESIGYLKAALAAAAAGERGGEV